MLEIQQSDAGTAGAPASELASAAFDPASIETAVHRLREPVHVVRERSAGHLGIAFGGVPDGLDFVGTIPAMYPEWLGDRSFAETHGTRFAYIAGAMANGIATTRLVADMAKSGMLGFFGAAGLPRDRVERAVDELSTELGDRYPWGANLIHSPQEPALERSVADMYLARGVTRVSASAYMDLTPAIVRFACSGLTEDARGIQRSRHVFAKISRPEVARRFLSPAPAVVVNALVKSGALSEEEARLSRFVPLAEDITVESDSGGHTDNRPLGAVFPCVTRLRDELVTEHGYARAPRVGAAGGIGAPSAVAGAFAMGAAYVLTGSVNQSAVQSGLSPAGRALLCQVGLADVQMAPAADMFEMGVKVQVLKRGSMFASRASRLYDLYQSYDSLEALPQRERERLEREILGQPLEQIWRQVEDFFTQRDASQLEIARTNPKHRMALVFRWYLGRSSRWAIDGDPSRKLDFQIWCGPAMGAFNDWVRGSFLEPAEQRDAVQIALNLLEGGATITRAQQLRSFGLPVPASAFTFSPRPLRIV